MHICVYASTCGCAHICIIVHKCAHICINVHINIKIKRFFNFQVHRTVCLLGKYVRTVA